MKGQTVLLIIFILLSLLFITITFDTANDLEKSKQQIKLLEEQKADLDCRLVVAIHREVKNPDLENKLFYIVANEVCRKTDGKSCSDLWDKKTGVLKEDKALVNKGENK